jgi:hypothetical protein
MYDDLLGPRKKKKKIKDIDIGKCYQCSFGKWVRKGNDIYCEEIKKYVHANQMTCLKFERKQVDFVSWA